MQVDSASGLFSIRSIESMNEICRPLFEHTDINFFRYTRVFRDGTCSTLLTHGEWQEYVMSQAFYCKNPYQEELVHNKWVSISQSSPNRMTSLVQEFLGMRDSIAITYQHETHKDVYVFGIKLNHKKSVAYYLQHADFLEHFIMYFKDQGASLLQRSFLYGNRIAMPGFIAVESKKEEESFNKRLQCFTQAMPVRRYHFEIAGEQRYLTRQEWCCLLGFLKNCSAKQVAKDLSLSPKTVETHLYAVRRKLECGTRQELYNKFKLTFPVCLSELQTTDK